MTSSQTTPIVTACTEDRCDWRGWSRETPGKPLPKCPLCGGKVRATAAGLRI